MPARPDDHWGKIASEFGVEATPQQPDADADQGAISEAIESQPSVEPKPAQSRMPEKPRVQAPPKKNTAKPVAHWDSLAGELGLEVPQREAEPEPEAEPEISPPPMVASKSPIDEIFVPRENIDEDVIELFESVRVERSDASYFDITESSSVDVEDSIEVIVEDLEEEVGTQPRRRRRRSRSRRSSPPGETVVDSQTEPRAELEIEAEAAEEILDPLFPEADDLAELAPVDPDAEEPSEFAPAEEKRPRSRRRPRRRRRSKGSESAERGKEEGRAGESPATVPAKRQADVDDLDIEDLDADDLDDDDDLPDEDESKSRGRRSKSKKITGWVEAVSVMVDANIERHKKGDSDRNRGGRPRGRRGR